MINIDVAKRAYVKVIKRRSCELKHVIASRIPKNHPSVRKLQLGRTKSVFEIIYGVDIPPSLKFDSRVLSMLASDPGETLENILMEITKEGSSFINIDFLVNPQNIKQSSSLKGSFLLPHIVDPTIKVAVFAKDDLAIAARAAGAEHVGAEDIAESILSGKASYSRIICAPDMLYILPKVAKVLGPKGLMPTVKSGTITDNFEQALRDVSFSAPYTFDKESGMISILVGNVDPSALGLNRTMENTKSVIEQLSSLSIGKSEGFYIILRIEHFIKAVYLRTAIQKPEEGLQLKISQLPEIH